MRNCKNCNRWRKLSDYKPYFSKKRNKEYLRKTCEFCCKKKALERYYNFSDKQKNDFRERTREYAAARRRQEGKPVRNIHKVGYGSGRVKKFVGCLNSVSPQPIISQAKKLQWNNDMIAKGAGVDIRRVRGWINNSDRINIDAADKLCFALGTHLSLIYPYDET